MLSVSETSPGRVNYRRVVITVRSSPTVLPFQAILHYVQDDRYTCHSELLAKNLPEVSITAEYKTTLRLVFYDEAFFYLFFFVVTHARR